MHLSVIDEDGNYAEIPDSDARSHSSAMFTVQLGSPIYMTEVRLISVTGNQRKMRCTKLPPQGKLDNSYQHMYKRTTKIFLHHCSYLKLDA